MTILVIGNGSGWRVSLGLRSNTSSHPEWSLRTFEIPPFGSVPIPGLSDAQIAEVVAQNLKYGLISIDEAPADYTGLWYALGSE
ncbi:hypothetical+protein [Methylocapsa aurea]|uniref:hypothetical protein n=1 Tax=Methylocapsa aurea TaxID=663610 RepID=UPI003D18CA16